MILKRKLAWRAIKKAQDDTALRISLLATFTIDPLVPFIGTAMHAEGIPARMHVAPYDQIVAQCVDPTSDTATFAPGVLVVWPRFEDLWRGRGLPLCEPLADFAEPLLAIVDAAVSASASLKATLVFVLPVLPNLRPLGVGDAGNPEGVMATASGAREAARRQLAATPGVLIADAEEVVRELGVRKALDPRSMVIARIPYSDAAFADAADRIARLLRIARRGAAKVAVVDADNTLWGGVVGEDGPRWHRPARQRAGRGVPRVPGLAGRAASRRHADRRRLEEQRRRCVGRIRSTRDGAAPGASRRVARELEREIRQHGRDGRGAESRHAELRVHR